MKLLLCDDIQLTALLRQQLASQRQSALRAFISSESVDEGAQPTKQKISNQLGGGSAVGTGFALISDL